MLEGAAGTRNLLELDWCKVLSNDARTLGVAKQVVGPRAKPVRAILFDKSPQANWNLGWHQDTKIAVKRRLDVPGFTAWSEKEGIAHCQPNQAILEQSLAIRIHLDPCGPANGPLQVIPGSHRQGIQTTMKDDPAQQEIACQAEQGDTLLMRPLLWHASSKSQSPSHRHPH